MMCIHIRIKKTRGSVLVNRRNLVKAHKKKVKSNI